jgi:Tfp pilus assembly protein PilF
VAEAAMRALTRSSNEADRMWGYAALNLSLQEKGDNAGAIEATNAALAIAPKFNLAYANRAGAHQSLGHAEAAYRDQVMAWRSARSDGRRFMGAEGLAFVTESWLAFSRMALGDYLGAIEPLERSVVLRPGDTQQMAALSLVHAALHDASGAREARGALISGGPDAATTAADLASLSAAADAAREDWAAVVRDLAEVEVSDLAAGPRARFQVVAYPLLATALARTGEVDRAAGLIAATATDCYECVIARGVVAEAAGDRAGADRWLAEAIRQGPSLPFAHEARGRLRLARGDLAGAVADFREANRRGPGWADPLKGWGDALARQGDAAGAARQYRAGAERAPLWGALQLAWGRALAAQGQAATARDKYREAARLDLSAADRAAVTRLLAARA